MPGDGPRQRWDLRGHCCCPARLAHPPGVSCTRERGYRHVWESSTCRRLQQELLEKTLVTTRHQGPLSASVWPLSQRGLMTTGGTGHGTDLVACPRPTATQLSSLPAHHHPTITPQWIPLPAPHTAQTRSAGAQHRFGKSHSIAPEHHTLSAPSRELGFGGAGPARAEVALLRGDEATRGSPGACSAGTSLAPDRPGTLRPRGPRRRLGTGPGNSSQLRIRPWRRTRGSPSGAARGRGALRGP